MNMRIMALDVGTKTLGVAVSDSEEKLALGVATLDRRSLSSDCAAVRELAEKRRVGSIVVGWPLTTQGREGRAVERTRVFVEALRRTLDLPVETWDERFTTAEAEEILLKGGATPTKRRAAVDAVAAMLILQAYLDARGEGRGK
jgi:putative Holliday junction resolvase